MSYQAYLRARPVQVTHDAAPTGLHPLTLRSVVDQEADFRPQ